MDGCRLSEGPANVGDGYLLELVISLSGEEGDILGPDGSSREWGGGLPRGLAS